MSDEPQRGKLTLEQRERLVGAMTECTRKLRLTLDASRRAAAELARFHRAYEASRAGSRGEVERLDK